MQDSIFTVGQAVIFGDMANPDKVGHVAKIEAHEQKIFTIGAGGMKREYFQITVAWEDLSFSAVSEGVAKTWAEKAAKRGLPHITAADALDRLEDARQAQHKAQELRRKESEEAARKVDEWCDSIRDKIPADAAAVIVAELEQDESDSMTDYFSTRTVRTVILAFSRHTRNNFAEFRKAAANFAETVHLADADKDAEHRDAWSMGAGYYLKDSRRYSSGWAIRKRVFYRRNEVNDLAQLMPVGDWHVPAGAPFATGPKPEPKPAPDQESAEPIEAEAVGGVTISTHTHTKKGFRMFICELPDRVSREAFTRLLSEAKGLRGWYSRKWGQTPAGFAFKDQDKAREFAAFAAGQIGEAA